MQCGLLGAIGAAMLCSGLALAESPASKSPSGPGETSAATDATKKSPAKASANTAKTTFVRLATMMDRPVSLDTAITSYVGRDAAGREVRVDLVGAIHIADKAYYQQLNKEFDKYEVVLYELVAPKGAVPQRGSAGLYSPVARMLSLADQIAEVDYTKKHFVHADMSGEEMAESMKKRNESWLKLIGKAIGQGIVQSSDPNGQTTDAKLLANLFSAKNTALAWKRTLAPQFSDLEGSMSWLDGPDGSTLITERNKVALQVLSAQLKAGKRNIAIFYGAGHLSDMEQRLLGDFKLQKAEQRWLTAWMLK